MQGPHSPEVARAIKAILETAKGAALFGGTGATFYGMYYWLLRNTRIARGDDVRMNAIERLQAEGERCLVGKETSREECGDGGCFEEDWRMAA